MWLANRVFPESNTLLMKPASFKVILVSSLCIILVWSAIDPYEYFTWFLEVAPVLIALPVLLLTGKRFEFTALIYGLLWIHAVILIIGGHYTYARMPLFDWLRDVFDLGRNHYDRLGHLAQGFIPAMVTREVLLRNRVVQPGGWLFFLTTCVVVAISAAYELIEWAVARGTGSAATDFLGTQGDVWDTQTDMFLALVGALLAQVLLKGIHNRAMHDLESSSQF